jgi:hypothetical protein
VPKNVHTVEQPEHLAAIAAGMQRESFAKIWNDPDNAPLRQRRVAPHVLLPGDSIVIPDRDPLIYARPTGKQHVFTVQLMPLKLNLVVLDELRKPIACTAGTLLANGDEQDVETDGDGKIQATVDPGTTSATLTLGARTFTLAVGHIDPIEETSGQLGRLQALGYFDGEVPEAADFPTVKPAIETAMHLAWELFQDDNGLTVTGIGDDDSVGKLKDVFGG